MKLIMWLFLLLLKTTAEPASSAPPGSTCVLPAGTEVLLETTEGISSATARIGQHVSYRLAKPIATGKAPVPAGQPAAGDVVHAARASWSGRAGELILAARYIEYGSTKIPLRSFRLMAAGDKAIGRTIVRGVGIFPRYVSSEVVIPKGVTASAKLATDVSVAC